MQSKQVNIYCDLCVKTQLTWRWLVVPHSKKELGQDFLVIVDIFVIGDNNKQSKLVISINDTRVEILQNSENV